ncbi:ferredoxin reductase [Cnuibacter physcomitrellae]|uniref:ferredoxin reductase n=1 Tax=Cnuibacter physcomitrellae TaxID=1619308 RepID=UPI002877AB55|nr:ferredoxin reductase [Cnuibacter physcomitrellae]
MAIVSDWTTGTVSGGEKITPTGRILRLDVPSWPGNLPGQHLDLRLTADDGYQAVRSYSIASYGPGTTVELAVDELPDGEVSPYLVEDVQPGDQLEVRGPIGNYFVWREQQTEPVQLIAGGSGIVPLVSIVRAHQASSSAAPFRMIYSVRAPEDAYYAAELDSYSGDRFSLEWVYTRTTPAGWARPAGRIDRAVIEASALPASDDPTVYVCGPTGFVEAVARILVDLGHDPGRVKTERFGGA